MLEIINTYRFLSGRPEWREHLGDLRAYGMINIKRKLLASGTRVRGFEPGRSRSIFRASEKSSAYLPSEGK